MREVAQGQRDRGLFAKTGELPVFVERKIKRLAALRAKPKACEKGINALPKSITPQALEFSGGFSMEREGGSPPQRQEKSAQQRIIGEDVVAGYAVVELAEVIPKSVLGSPIGRYSRA